MKPINFHPHERLLGGPPHQPQYRPLPVVPTILPEGHAVVSCWKPTPEECLQIFLGRPIFLAILSTNQPPVILTTDLSNLNVKYTIEKS